MIKNEHIKGRAGVDSAGSAYNQGNANGHCIICGQKLLQIPCLPQRLYAHACNNIFCSYDRSPQFYTKIPDDQISQTKTTDIFRTPTSTGYLSQKRANYRLLRSLRVPAIEAARMNTNKQTNLYLESIGYERGK